VGRDRRSGIGTEVDEKETRAEGHGGDRERW
jgi:hypothetical protein